MGTLHQTLPVSDLAVCRRFLSSFIGLSISIFCLSTVLALLRAVLKTCSLTLAVSELVGIRVVSIRSSLVHGS